MKRRLLLFFPTFLSTALLCTGSLLCPVSAFSLPADPVRLLISGTVLAAVFSLLSVLPKRKLCALIALALTILAIILSYDAVIASADVSVQAVINVFSQAFPSLRGLVMPVEGDATPIFGLLQLAICLVCAYSIPDGGTWPALLCTAPFAAVSTLILEYGPAAYAAVSYLAGVGLLFLTGLLRKRNTLQGAKLMLRLSVPLAVLLAVLCFFVPQESYRRSAWADQLRDRLNEVAAKLSVFSVDDRTGQVRVVSPLKMSLGSSGWNASVQSIDLNAVSPQVKTGRSVMSVLSPVSGEQYLRGYSLGVYQDNQWSAIDLSDEELRSDSVHSAEHIPSELATEQIRTNAASSVYYLPYSAFPPQKDAEFVQDSYYRNESREKDYLFDFAQARDVLSPSLSEKLTKELYTQVPSQTRNELTDILCWIPVWNTSPYETVEYLRDYVSQSARYDLNTPSCPEGEDFVVWFLNESETGYCIHYASALTMLLRCMDIPARLVVGYLAQPVSNVWTPVTEDTAHAWTEVYLDGVWFPIDATPEDWTSQTTGTISDNKETSDPSPKPVTDKPEKPERLEAPEKPENDVLEEAKNKPASLPEAEKKAVPVWVWWLLGAALLILAWNIAIRIYRKNAMWKGSPNRQAVGIYRHMQFLKKLSKTPIPKQSEQLAMKARFSQHTLTENELESLRMDAAEQERIMDEAANPLKKLAIRIFLALPEKRRWNRNTFIDTKTKPGE